MGCLVSTPSDVGEVRRWPGNIGEVVIFVPGLRIPKSINFSQSLGDRLARNLVERVSALRTKIVVMAAQEAPTVTRQRRKTRHGGSSTADLRQALEDYLPVLLGLVKEGSQLTDKVEFVWVNQEDDAAETGMANAWYEVLSVLHFMALLCLSEANSLLLPKSSYEDHHPKVSEENRRNSIDILLKAAGYLDYAVQHVLPKVPPEQRKDLPIDLSENILRSLCLQSLGQSVDLQLGLAIDSPKATLAVKRRLACEMFKCWQQAEDIISHVSFSDGWGGKHKLFVKWKYFESKAAAYYYHGVILNEGNTAQSHKMAVAALQEAEEFMKESKRTCEAFHAMPPISRNPSPWGSMKYLSEKILKDTSSKVRVNRDLYNNDGETAPPLPEFPVALKPDDYQLPPLDSCWNK